MQLVLLLAAVCASLASGWHVHDPEERVVEPANVTRGFLVCPCSASRSSCALATRQAVDEALHVLNHILPPLANTASNRTTVRSSVRDDARAMLQECFNKSGYQACINADEMLRIKYSTPFCSYDAYTRRNVARNADGIWVTTGSRCPWREFDRNAQFMRRDSARVHASFAWCWCSPTQNGTAVEPGALDMMRSALQELSMGGNAELAQSKLAMCSRRHGYAKCVDADRELRASFNETMCRHDMQSGKNVGPDFLGDPDGVVTLGQCRVDADTFVMPAVLQDRGAAAVTAKNTRGGASSPMNEGCVAVEHLRGAALQHRRHLRREVLCYDGLCATSNHGVWYRGAYTSMECICRARACARHVAWVNNLRIAANKRWPVGEHWVVSPYDVRFPWWCAWLVQMLEDCARLALAGVLAGALLSVAGVLAARAEIKLRVE